MQTICAPANTSIPLVATANGGFMLDAHMWHHTSGDTGSGEMGTWTGTGATAMSSASFMTGASGTACAWVCCPGSGFPCPTTDTQCP
jgi:hypothetical protein